jgi:hypothetical protein
MFLRRSNLLKDLSVNLKGKLKDPATVTLKGGGVGGIGLLNAGKGMKSGLESHGKQPDAAEPKDVVKPKPLPDRVEATKSGELSDKLVAAKGTQQDGILKELKAGKGAEFTEALALAIPRLQGEIREKTRDTLAERLTRMSARQLGEYMKNDDPEIRRGALIASYMKDVRENIPLLIERLSDTDPGVARAAAVVLKEMTKQDFGPEPGADREELNKAIAAWKDWWARQGNR